MENSLTKRRMTPRAKQLVAAQNSYRDRKRQAGCQRIQEWVQGETLVQLKSVTQRTGIGRAQLIETLVAAAFAGKIDPCILAEYTCESGAGVRGGQNAG